MITYDYMLLPNSKEALNCALYLSERSWKSEDPLADQLAAIRLVWGVFHTDRAVRTSQEFVHFTKSPAGRLLIGRHNPVIDATLKELYENSKQYAAYARSKAT